MGWDENSRGVGWGIITKTDTLKDQGGLRYDNRAEVGWDENRRGIGWGIITKTDTLKR